MLRVRTKLKPALFSSLLDNEDIAKLNVMPLLLPCAVSANNTSQKEAIYLYEDGCSGGMRAVARAKRSEDANGKKTELEIEYETSGIDTDEQLPWRGRVEGGWHEILYLGTLHG